jgi:hypothetical protein
MAIPQIWEHSTLKAMYFFGLMVAVISLVTGRHRRTRLAGVMLPDLQKKYSLLGCLAGVIAVFWNTVAYSAAFVTDFMSESIVIGMAQRSVMVVPLALMTTWLYRKTDGNLLLLVLLPRDVQPYVADPAKSDVIAGRFWFVFSVVITLKDKL